ncbi:MAG: amino acid aminotransferase [Bacteroidetes bacterium]|nr:MAG: amino acid aminotransferase [Bacteroidota bacterium]PTM13058.1 MAG: amino acid aminotransferase [Bacteroidota bacterium]
MYCYLNGKMLPTHEASLGLNDLALLRGYGIFDFFVFEHFHPRFLEDYLDRFFRSAAYLGLQSPVSRADFRTSILQLIAANQQEKGGIRLVLTGGYSDDGFTPGLGNIFILQSAFVVPPAHQFATGVRVMTYQHQRELPLVKSLNYLTGINLLPTLREQEADFVLFHDGTYVRESDRSNFFIINETGQLVTPKEKVLAGITRAKIIELAKALGIPVAEREIPLEELATAREAFLTSSTKGALPVTLLDGQPVGDGQPGPISQQLQTAFLDLVERSLLVK